MYIYNVNIYIYIHYIYTYIIVIYITLCAFPWTWKSHITRLWSRTSHFWDWGHLKEPVRLAVPHSGQPSSDQSDMVVNLVVTLLPTDVLDFLGRQTRYFIFMCIYILYIFIYLHVYIHGSSLNLIPQCHHVLDLYTCIGFPMLVAFLLGCTFRFFVPAEVGEWTLSCAQRVGFVLVAAKLCKASVNGVPSGYD